MPQAGFFDIDRRLESISRMGDPLERLAVEIPWELFRPLLEKVREKDRKSAAGRKPFDVVLMFKVLVLQTLYNLADEAVEYQIRDRLLFARFLGLEMYDSVPDGTTVWRFRERLKELELIKPLFDRFGDYLARAGLEARNRADRRRLDRARAGAAQQPRGEPPHPGGRGARGLGRQQSPAEGHRSPLDQEAWQEPLR